MSHQTGIQANDELRTYFGKCKDGKIRVVKVGIHKEELTLDAYREANGTWEEDYDALVAPLVQENQPCYLFYRLDSMNNIGYEWVFISWSPDNSPIREKMLYASTKATLKKEFGGGQVKHEIFATTTDDVNLQGYLRLLDDKVPAPLTFAEEELQMIKMNESGTDIGVDSRHQTLQSLVFPVEESATAALYDLKEGVINYVQLCINVEKEEIHLATKETISDVANLSQYVPSDHARYHLFCFHHFYEGDLLVSTVFIYSVPGCSCPIRERMLYSSCKSSLIESIEKKIGIEIAKKIEIDDPAELTKDFLIDELHPKTCIFKQKFAKPKGPGHRGARRLIRTTQSDGEGDDAKT